MFNKLLTVVNNSVNKGTTSFLFLIMYQIQLINRIIMKCYLRVLCVEKYNICQPVSLKTVH